METLATWAATKFGTVQVGDRRHTRRAVAFVTALGQQPAASLPRVCGSWAARKSTYRLLHSPAVSRPALREPHWPHTRQAAEAAGLTLFISDLTELDYTRYHAVTGLGEIGDGHQRGFHVQTTLAYRPAEDHSCPTDLPSPA